MAFGKKNENNKKSSKSSKRVYPPKRIWPNSRMYVRPNSSAKAIVLDDRADYTESQVDALAVLGIEIGPFYVDQHNACLPSFGGKPRWTNWFTCNNHFSLNRIFRLKLLKVMGLWDSMGEFLSENPDKADDLYMGKFMDRNLLEQIYSDKQIEYGEELFNLPLDGKWDCPIDALADFTTGKDQEGKNIRPFGQVVKWAKETAFQTVVSRSSYKKKDGTLVKDPLALIASDGDGLAAVESFAAETNKFKSRVGLGKYEIMFTRAGQTSPKPGAPSLNDELTLEQIQEINPDAVIALDKKKIKEILTEDNNFRMHCHYAETGKQVTVAALTKTLAEELCPKGTVLYPWPMEYSMELLPKSPTYLNKVFEEHLRKLEMLSSTDEIFEDEEDFDEDFSDLPTEEIPF